MIFGFIVFITILLVYSPWFSFSGTLSSGDWPFLYVENIKEFSFLPQAQFLWLAPYYQIPAKIFVQYLNLPWELFERMFWFWPFIGISIASSYYLTRSWIGVLIYTTYTYILMIVAGGQMGIAMAYAISPFVLRKFIDFVDSLLNVILSEQERPKNLMRFFAFAQDDNVKRAILIGLVLSVLTMFDPRVAYIIVIAVAIYGLLNIKFLHSVFHVLYSVFFIPILIAAILNSYWIVPLFRKGADLVIENFDSSLGFEYFSFADFSHAFSLLHPNWPENIFGKTYFLQPEFLILPVIAYISLLFIKNSKQIQNSKLQNKNNLTMRQLSNGTILFFALLGIVGAFLAKGANPPFGEVNLWLFENFPGMSMFRDPTKFYILVVLSYSILVPFSIVSLSKWVNSKFKIQNYLPNLFLLFTILYLIFLIRPAIFGQLSGTFKSHTVPQEYIELKNFIKAQNESFGILWIPEKHRYGFYSGYNPFVSAREFMDIHDPVKLAIELRNRNENQWNTRLLDMNIRYIIVPYDSQEELFIEDRLTSEKAREQVEKELDGIEWLFGKKTFGRITMYELKH